MNEEKLKEGQKIGHNWANPIWRNTDGSVAEW
jgi:galactonate dehydratase